MNENTTIQSGLRVNITLVNKYIKNGKLVYTYGISGDPVAVAQYVADQANKPKGCQYHEVTKAPLFWSNDLGETATRGRTGDWRVSNDFVRAASQEIDKQTRVGNEVLANRIADKLADSILDNIKSTLKVRGTSAATSAAGTTPSTAEQQPAASTPEGLDGV